MTSGRINSRRKGARAERLWRDELRANGYTARRGQQFAGSPDSPDVVCEELDWIHFEVKAVERLNIWDAMDQARRDARKSREQKSESRNGEDHLTPALSPSGEGDPTSKVPIVTHTRNFRPWLVTMDAETFFRFLRGDFTGGNGGKGGPCGRGPNNLGTARSESDALPETDNINKQRKEKHSYESGT